MSFRRHVARALHQDHIASRAILVRLEALLGQHGPDRPPAVAAGATASLLRDLVHALDVEIGPHFAFEEDAVFPFLAAGGDDEIGNLLADEHREILPLALRASDLARLGRDVGFSPAAWAEFHTVGAALAERLVAHIDKEDGALLPALDDALDPETDNSLAIQFAAAR